MNGPFGWLVGGATSLTPSLPAACFFCLCCSYGHREDPLTICAKIDAVTAEDLQRVARTITRGTPSFVAYGDQDQVQTYDAILEGFKNVNEQIGNLEEP